MSRSRNTWRCPHHILCIFLSAQAAKADTAPSPANPAKKEKKADTAPPPANPAKKEKNADTAKKYDNSIHKARRQRQKEKKLGKKAGRKKS